MKIPMYIAVQLETGCGGYSRRVWLPLPATKTQFETTRKTIDPCCRGITINHYGVRVPGISRYLLAETPLAQVNHLASRLEKLDDEQILKLCVIIESEMYFISVAQFIEYTYNTNKFALCPDIHSEEDLARRELEKLDLPPIVKQCIDLRMLGNVVAAGEFTSFGYLTRDPSWQAVPSKRRVPVSLDLKGDFGEELYVEFDIDEEYYGL